MRHDHKRSTFNGISRHDCILALRAAGISTDDAVDLRRISMTLHRWHELECGDGNSYGSWAIETLPVTKKAIHTISSPACYPRYGMIVPCYSECKQVDGRWVVADTSKVKRNDGTRDTLLEHDLEHYHIWIAEADVVELPFMMRHHYLHGRGKDYTTKTRIADRERGALKRLAKIMARYPNFQSYVQGDPRGCALYILRPGDVPEDATIDSCYSRGIAVYK